MKLILACRQDNDIYRVLCENHIPSLRYDTAMQAVTHAPYGAGILLLADGYPEERLAVDAAILQQAQASNSRLYIEYPCELPGMDFDQVRDVAWERTVVTSGVFAPEVTPGRILMTHGCRFVQATAPNAYLALARVAGFDTAIYGLPERSYPVLFEQAPHVLVATTKLSQCITARFAPVACWAAVWRWILQWAAQETMPSLHWTTVVRPAYGPEDLLPNDVEAQAWRRGIEWFHRARMLIDATWQEEAERRIHTFPDGTGQAPSAFWPAGDGSYGVLEGVSSFIRPDGAQDVRYFLRNDCTGETSMAMALYGAHTGRKQEKEVAANLNDFLYFHSHLAESHRTDPQYPLHGLLRFSNDEIYGHAYYGDDTARSVLGTLVTAKLLGETRWNDSVLRALLANLRTTGPQGFRSNRLEEADLLQKGWRYFQQQPRTNFRPHYEGWVWAIFLRAWALTGYQPFFDIARSAIHLTMAAYPGQWRWANGMQQERARMLLPLAWLVRVEDTVEHRRWLRYMAGELLARQDVSGAIPEELGDPEMGSYNPPRSNEAYGEDEAPLIQQNGDPLCDQLYTTNYALAGLHEAAAATCDPYYTAAEDRLVRFLCRIQVRSACHPELDGAWFRAFDYQQWEYWASNSDQSWGAWCVETGWTQAWITTVLALRQMTTSLWEVTEGVPLQAHLATLVAQLLPDD